MDGATKMENSHISQVPVDATWHSRWYLPHVDMAGRMQGITYRLADAIPHEALERLERELANEPEELRDIRYRQALERYLDAGHGCCCLRHPACAEVVLENWRRFDGVRYRLIAWVVMPNHVHVLIHPHPGWSLAKIVQSWKSYTAKKILAMECRRTGSAGGPSATVLPSHTLWQREYWDRYIRDEKHYTQAVNYIHNNPVKAGLVEKACDWIWSSAGLFLAHGGNETTFAGRRPALPVGEP